MFEVAGFCSASFLFISGSIKFIKGTHQRDSLAIHGHLTQLITESVSMGCAVQIQKDRITCTGT